MTISESNKTKYQNQVENIIQLFTVLEAWASKILFPKPNIGAVKEPDLEKWHPWRAFLYRTSHPYSSAKNLGPFAIFGLIYLPIGVFIGFSYGFSLLFPQNPDVSILFPPTTLEETVIYLTYSMLIFPLLLVAYYWWFDVFVLSRYITKIKMFLFILVLSSMFLVSIYFSNHSLYPGAFENPHNAYEILCVFVLFITPSFTYSIAVFFDLVLVVMNSIKKIGRFLSSFHLPLHLDNIRVVVSEEFSNSNKEGKTYDLANMDERTLKALVSLARESRTATVHRILPTTLVLGLLAVLVTIDPIRTVIAQKVSLLGDFVVSYVKSPRTTNSFGRVFLVIGIYVTLRFIRIYIELFRNLAIQNLVIESCTVAMYARDER